MAPWKRLEVRDCLKLYQVMTKFSVTLWNFLANVFSGNVAYQITLLFNSQVLYFAFLCLE